MSFTLNLLPTRGRSCAGCTLCCKLVPVGTLQKKAGEKCEHMRRHGCKIYDRRPVECMIWSCAWLTDPDTAKLRRPDHAHYVIDPMPDTLRIQNNETGEVTESDVMQVWLDVDCPGAHRDPELRAYIEHVAETRNMATIVRRNNTSGLLLAAPCLSKDGHWVEREVGKPNPNFGRYSRLPDDQRAPL